MGIILITAIIAAIIPFVAITYIPLLAASLAICVYILLNNKSKAPLIIAITFLLIIFVRSYTQKSTVDNLTSYLQQRKIDLAMEIIEVKEEYYVLSILETKANKIKSGHSLLLYSQKEYNKGDIISYQGEVKQFYQYKNPGTYYPNNKYVYKRYGYISETTGSIQRLENKIENKTTLNHIKSKVLLRLQTLDIKGASLAPAILLGDKNQIDNEYVESFRDSGLIHITAVSGLHIGIVFMIFTYLITILTKNKKLSYIAGFFMALVFSVFVGFKPSTLRAITMLFIYMISKTMGYPYSLSRSVQVTALIFITLNPLVLMDMGFQFSYGAVLGIAYISPRLKILDKIKSSYIQNILRITLSVQLALLPLNYYYFKGLPIFSVVSNLLVAPVLPPYLGLIMGYAIFPIGIFRITIEILSNYILIWSKITAIWLHLSMVKLLGVSVVALSIIGYYLHKNKVISSKKLLAFVLCCAISIASVLYVQPQVEIYFLDVGQGDCIIIRHKGTNILIDTGGTMGTNIGQRVVVPVLKHLGIQRLDYLFLTHPHYDHIGALPEIVNKIKVKNLLIPQNESMLTSTYINIIKQVEGQIPNTINVKKGDSLSVSKLKIEVLHPTSTYTPNESTSNNISLVMLLQYGETKVLFTGDIESAEKDIIHLLPKVEILKIAHHGSSTSSSEEFLSKTLPKHAIISVGNNNYGHPSEEVLDRLNGINSNYHITKYTGMVSVKIKDKGFIVKDHVR